MNHRFTVHLVLSIALLIGTVLPGLGCGSRELVRYTPGDERIERTVRTSGFFELHLRTDDRRRAVWDDTVVYVSRGETIGFDVVDGVVHAHYGSRSAALDRLPTNTRYVSWQREQTRGDVTFGDAASNVVITVASIVLIVGTVGLLILVAGSDGDVFDAR